MARKDKKEQDQQFIYYWYRVFKWKENPFDKKDLEPISNYISGYQDERKKLNYFIIEKQPLCHIYGEDGFGKTTLLKWLIVQLSRYKDRVMVDFVDKDIKINEIVKLLINPLLSLREKTIIGSNIFNIEKLAGMINDNNLKIIYESIYLKKRNFEFINLKSFLSSRLGSKHLVLIIDDFDKLNQDVMKLVQMLIESDINMQVMLSSTKDHLEIKKKDCLNVHLNGMTFESALGMVTKRIMSVNGIGYEPFSDDELKRLYEKSNKNPVEFLNLCKKKAIKKALDTINSEELDEIKTEEKSEDVKENKEDKAYEIKVIDHKSDKPTSIKIVKSGKSEYIPSKVDKEERKFQKK